MFGFVDDDDVIVMLSQQRSQVHIGDDGCCCCVTKEDDGVESEGGVVRLSSKDDGGSGGGGGVAGLNANDVDGNGVCAVSQPTLSVQHQPQVVLRQRRHNTFARRCCHLLIVDAIVVVGLTQLQEAVMNL